jgi:hypothetical protein
MKRLKAGACYVTNWTLNAHSFDNKNVIIEPKSIVTFVGKIVDNYYTFPASHAYAFMSDTTVFYVSEEWATRYMFNDRREQHYLIEINEINSKNW